MKRKLAVIGVILCVSLASCGAGRENETIEGAVETVKYRTEETLRDAIEKTTSAFAKEVDLKNSLEITDIVSGIWKNYDAYKEIALKHGMIYTDGTKTNGPVMMEEITPYKPGEEVAEYDLVARESRHRIVPEEPEDYETIYEEIKDLEETGLLKFIESDCLDDYWPGEEGISDDLPEVEILRLVNTERFRKYAGITVDDWTKLSLGEQRDLTAKMAIQWRKNHNVIIRQINEETEKENAILEAHKRKVPKGAGKEYNAWYKSNERIIIIISNIDFTAEKKLPEYVTEYEGGYYITEDALKTLWKEQGSPEDKNLELNVYGYRFYYDVSSLYQDW